MKNIILKINEKIIEERNAKKIISKLNSLNNSKVVVGLDMSEVTAINSISFIKSLTNNNVKMFNLNLELLAYFRMIFKQNLKSYLNEQDFLTNKREFVKRNFLVA